MYRNEMAGAYSVTPFRHSVIRHSVLPSLCHSVLPDSVSAHYLCHVWKFSNEIWYMALSRIRRLSSNLGPVEQFLAELCPLDLEKFHLFSVSAHYLHYKLTF